jgi:hypothetical protein
MIKSVTIFRPPRWWEEEQRWVYDNKTHRRMDFATWKDFVTFIYALAKRPKEGKKDAELISPAVFEPGAKRRKTTVLAWAGWAAVDIDSWELEGSVEDELRSRIGDWNYCVYSTASSTVEKPKFRVLFDLDRDIQAAEIKHFWWALQSHLEDKGDKQCKDLCRMYYIPAQYAKADNFVFHNDGVPVDVDRLMAKYPLPQSKHGLFGKLPEEWQKQLIGFHKDSLDNASITWTSYRDCPFVSKKILDSWFAIANTDGSGRYRHVYKMMVSIAGEAIRKKYPITPGQIVDLVLQIDADSSRKYTDRALEVEAENAIKYAFTRAL